MGCRATRPVAAQLEGAQLVSIAVSSTCDGLSYTTGVGAGRGGGYLSGPARRGPPQPSGYRVRLITTKGQPRTIEVTSHEPLACTYKLHTHDASEGYLAALLAKEASSSSAASSAGGGGQYAGAICGACVDWRLSNLSVEFTLVRRGHPDTRVRISGPGLVRAVWREEHELWNWEPDAKRESCPLCRTRFGWKVRKHHCRACGRVVCGVCSGHTAVVPAIPDEGRGCCRTGLCVCGGCTLCAVDSRAAADVSVRVCNDCYYGPTVSSPLASPLPPLQECLTVRSGSSGSSGVSDGAYYDDIGRLHIRPPANRHTILLVHNQLPAWGALQM